MAHRYTAEQKRWLLDHRPHCPIAVLTSGFNARFGTAQSVDKIRAFFKCRHVACPEDVRQPQSKEYTNEQKAWLMEHGRHCANDVLAAGFAAKFGVAVTPGAIKSFLQRKRVKRPAALISRFKPGHVPANKGKTGWQSEACKATAFRPGNRPINTLPIGAIAWKGTNHKKGEIGYQAIKVAEPNVWEYLHVRAWEAAHGPKPAGMRIIFVDGDRTNVDIANLALVSIGELAVLNKMRYNSAPAELKPTIFTLAKLKALAGRRRRESQHHSDVKAL